MFADGVMESSDTLGDGAAYDLAGAEYNGITFAAAFGHNVPVCYIAQTESRNKYEIMLGVHTVGSPNQLTRGTVLLSSQGGAKVDWQAGDIYLIASFSSATVLAGLIKHNLAASRPWWVQFGKWVREDYPTAGLHTEYFYDGVSDIPLGVIDEAAHTYSPSHLSATGVAAFLAVPSSANLLAMLTTKTGTGLAVFGTAPTISAPVFTGNVTVPDKAQAANDGYAVNSKYVDRIGFQQIEFKTNNNLVITTGTAMPADDTIPTNAEGDEYTQLAITLIRKGSGTSRLFIEIEVAVSRPAGGDYVSMALFRDSVSAAICARTIYCSGDAPILMRLGHTMVADAASIDFKVRFGSNTASILRFNGNSTGRYMGGVQLSFMKIEEYGM